LFVYGYGDITLKIQLSQHVKN